MELSVLNQSGSEVRKLQVSDDVFMTTASPSVVHSVVRWQRAKQRSGTHATMNLSKMPGGTRKPWKQKGLGRARAGSVNSPLWVGGAVIFGPQPRDYTFKLPRKVRRQALFGVLSEKAAAGNLVVVDSISGVIGEQPKTKSFAALLANLRLSVNDKIDISVNGEEGGAQRATRVAFIFSPGEEHAVVAARNIANVHCLPLAGVNVYDIVNATHVLLSEETLKGLQESLVNRK